MDDNEINKRCGVEGCERPVDARGFCKAHYNRWRRHGDPLVCRPRGGKTHGLSATREHKIWRAMKGRCGNPNSTSYHKYGARGISVCERWASFHSFIEDMGKAPSEAHSIERIDNDGPYAPENCRWATPQEQANNCRTNRRISFLGRELTISQWAVEIGISQRTLVARLDKLKWPIDRALTTPARQKSGRAST